MTRWIRIFVLVFLLGGLWLAPSKGMAQQATNGAATPAPVVAADSPAAPTTATPSPPVAEENPATAAPAPAAAIPGPSVRAPDLPYVYPFSDPDMARQLNAVPMVVELYTSLDCMFCPRAEKLLSDMAQQTSVVLLACHTDPAGSDYPLAQDFCLQRQENYAAALSDGLQYTPQMVFNGHIDAVGHEFEDVKLAATQALQDSLFVPHLRPTSEARIYALDMPKTDLGEHTADVILVTYRKPYTVPKTQRQSQLRPDPLLHVAKRLSPIGGWDGRAKTMTLSFALDDDEAGLIILVQRSDGTIIGAADISAEKLAALIPTDPAASTEPLQNTPKN